MGDELLDKVSRVEARGRATSFGWKTLRKSPKGFSLNRLPFCATVWMDAWDVRFLMQSGIHSGGYGHMQSKSFERKRKEVLPVLAICYDFDKTLSPDDMQAQGYIQSVGYDVAEFWKETNELAEKNDMDQNLAYMYKMVQEAEGRMVFSKQRLAEYGAKVTLFPGVEGWFERIRAFGKTNGVCVEHYIISSGLKEMIEGTSVAKAGAFERIYASSFFYNDRGVATWPAQVVNYTNKTQFLFRIEKGVLDVNDSGVNDYFAPEDMRVPFRNMVYIGDSDTDIPCMKLVNSYGGHSIGVFHAKTADKTKVYKMMRDGRIKYFAPTDYTEGSELDTLVKSIIVRTAKNEALEAISLACRRDFAKADSCGNEEERKKSDMILSLQESDSFTRTHEVIGRLSKHGNWTEQEKEKLFEIAVSNNQIFPILGDKDLRRFFSALLNGSSRLSENAEKVKAVISS